MAIAAFTSDDFIAHAAGAGSDQRSAVDLATRGHQIFPVLGPDDLRRLRRFAVARRWDDGATVFRACIDSPGMVVVLAGHLLCSRIDALGKRVDVVEYGWAGRADGTGKAGGNR